VTEAGKQCESPGCLASPLDPDLGLCLGHAPEGLRQAWLKRLAEEPPNQRIVDLRGVHLTQEMWAPITSALTEIGAVKNLWLAKAVVDCPFALTGVKVSMLSVQEVVFQGSLDIERCAFELAYFQRATFRSHFDLEGVEMAGGFIDCTFQGEVFFGAPNDPVVAAGSLGFARSRFEGYAEFNLKGGGEAIAFKEVKWSGPVTFHRLESGGDLSFEKADFGHDLNLLNVSLRGTLDLSGARFDALCGLGGEVGNLSLKQATFARAPALGPLRVREWAVLDQAVFEQQVRLRILAATLHCHRTIFTRGVTMAVAGDLIADGSFFPPPSDIAGVREESIVGEPQVVSLRGADIDGLNIAEIDLSGCLFAGVHHLEGARLGGGLRFGKPPGPWRGPRDVLAEEQLLRASEGAGAEWQGMGWLLPAWFANDEPVSDAPSRLFVDPPEVRDASSVADTYRALRQAREENKDSPGAAAFYFGEMEMRRKSLAGERLRDVPDRAVLASYWLLSGYGLRAWRSLLTLGVLLALSTLVLWQYGFRVDAVSMAHACRVAVASATSLVRPVDDGELNGTGFVVEIILRFAGPALLALAVLAIRARIKR
jgi:uncharacterized protein YjbI with pentapeptide repeats